MLTIKTSIHQSRIQGIGLFAEERVPKGATIWKFDSEFDRIFDPKEVNEMDELKKEFLYHFAYLEKTLRKFVLPVDDTRFINHSVRPNIVDIGIPGEKSCYSIACRDIEIGEEITIDYRSIDLNDEKSDEGYLMQ